MDGMTKRDKRTVPVSHKDIFLAIIGLLSPLTKFVFDDNSRFFYTNYHELSINFQ